MAEKKRVVLVVREDGSKWKMEHRIADEAARKATAELRRRRRE